MRGSIIPVRDYRVALKNGAPPSPMLLAAAQSQEHVPQRGGVESGWAVTSCAGWWPTVEWPDIFFISASRRVVGVRARAQCLSRRTSGAKGHSLPAVAERVCLLDGLLSHLRNAKGAGKPGLPELRLKIRVPRPSHPPPLPRLRSRLRFPSITP